MSRGAYDVRFTSGARRALTDRLPEAVAFAAYELIMGDLRREPYRVGKPLVHQLEGQYSARRGQYRVIYEVDEKAGEIIVVDIEHRRDAYRS